MNKVHNLDNGNQRASGEMVIEDGEPINMEYPIATISPPNISKANIDLN